MATSHVRINGQVGGETFVDVLIIGAGAFLSTYLALAKHCI